MKRELKAVQAAADTGAVISDQTMLEILETKGTGTDMHERLSRYCDEQITLVILGQTATTQGTPGKLGNEDAQSEVREDLIKADAADLAETIRNGLIWPLVGWNFGWDVLLPQFAFTFDKEEDLVAKGTTYKTLVEIGVPITVAQAQEEFGIRPAQGDAPLLQLRPSPWMGGGHGTIAAVAETDPTPATLQSDRMERDTGRSWTAIMDRIKKLVDDADSLPALRDSLLAEYADLPVQHLSEVMAMGFAAAELTGRYDTNIESQGGDDA